MMKTKFSLLMLSMFFLSPLAHAKSFSCPFSDYFALSVPGSAKIIGTPSVKGNLRITQQSDIFFMLSCGDDRDSGAGDLSIDIGYDDANKCSLGIHDGPYVMNPSITYVNCQGKMKYDGIDHVYGSYNYTLKFS